MQWMNRAKVIAVIWLCLCGFSDAGLCQDAGKSDANWVTIGGTAGNSHYSELKQINRSNVARLHVAWRFDTGQSGGLETTPIVVEGVLYAFTPTQQVIALDAATGKLLWKFDSKINGTGPDRGITYWTDGKERRLLAGVMNFVYALDPATGKIIPSFGKNGRIDLREDLGREPALQSVALTSPGVVYKDLLIVGGRNPETLPAPPGDIRAYDVRTGALRWSFHTIPHPGEFGYETWPKDAWKISGAANNWAGMAVDLKRGIVFAPTGSASPDFYGATRIGDDLFANTLLALDAQTGKRLWHFQGVHHDLWDRDFSAPPILVSVRRNGKNIPAVVQTTKQGYVYAFDRVTGEPLFPIEERTYPASTTPGEIASKTQPFPIMPPPFAKQNVTIDTLTNRTPMAHVWAAEQFQEIRHDGQFIPLSVDKDTFVYPGFEGGAEWGGPALDPETDVLYINANNYASIGALAVSSGGSPGRQTYLNQCAICHGEHRQGTGEFPSLLEISRKLTLEQITATIENGKGRMPAMPMESEALTNLLDYLTSEEIPSAGNTAVVKGQESATQYTMTGYRRFVDPDGYPATASPWGTLNALDLETGKYLWQIPLGQYPELVVRGMTETGSENYGGPIVTAGGLIFIAATNFDHKIRAFDKKTGELLWEATLPFAGNATPATYEVDGRQYVVIAAGGSNMNPRGPTGGVYVAYTLPR
jgi:quinoprotein glucose dehydrogenase